MQSKATTVEQYLAELPPDRREAIQKVREVFRKNLDKDYEEGMQYGAIGYYVPHRVFPDGYHRDPKKPLPFAGLGSQKNHLSLGMMCHYADDAERKWFEAAWAKTGKKLDMGACCIRFKKAEDLALDVIGESLRRMPAQRFIDMYQAMRQMGSTRRSRVASKKKPQIKSKAAAGTAGGKAKKKAGRTRAKANRRKVEK